LFATVGLTIAGSTVCAFDRRRDDLKVGSEAEPPCYREVVEHFGAK
jgi:hypothetical protein